VSFKIIYSRPLSLEPRYKNGEKNGRENCREDCAQSDAETRECGYRGVSFGPRALPKNNTLHTTNVEDRPSEGSKLLNTIKDSRIHNAISYKC
jgi:hypothetical protein